MRWLIFILAFLPNLVSADKAARDEFIEAASSLLKCAAALAPFIPNYSDPNYQYEIDKIRENRLIMQFEIDEIFYSEDNLAALAASFVNIADTKLSSLADEGTFSEDERQYVYVKIMNIAAEMEPFIAQLLESHKFHAGFIRQCAQSHNLAN